MNTFDVRRTKVSRLPDFGTEAFQDDAFELHAKSEERNTQRGLLLRRRAEQLERRPIQEIANLIRNLTYGEMIELAEGLWSVHPAASGISKDSLAGLLYRWSTTHDVKVLEFE